MAERLRSLIGNNWPRVLASCQRHQGLGGTRSKVTCKHGGLKRGEVSHCLDTESMQRGLRSWSDAKESADTQGVEKRGDFFIENHRNPGSLFHDAIANSRLCLSRGQLGDELG